jgi:branched-chain amino acid transport system permease protein
LVFGADPKDFPTLIERTTFTIGIATISNIQLIVLGTAIVLTIGLEFIVHRTRMGTAMRAVSFSHDAAGLMGINIDRVISFTFVLGSSLAAAAGILVGLYNPKIDPLMGIMPGLKAFVAAVLGGIGNIPGAILGGLIMGVAETITVGYLSSTYRDAITFVILVAVLLFRPTGILGKPQRTKF